MLTTMKAYASYAVKIYSNKQTKNNKTGVGGGRDLIRLLYTAENLVLIIKK